VEYIDIAKYDPSKVTKHAVLDQRVFDVVKLCLEANERGDVKTFSSEESASQLEMLGHEIRMLKQQTIRAAEQATAKASFRK
jgi:hypothetical protein